LSEKVEIMEKKRIRGRSKITLRRVRRWRKWRRKEHRGG